MSQHWSTDPDIRRRHRQPRPPALGPLLPLGSVDFVGVATNAGTRWSRLDVWSIGSGGESYAPSR